MNSADTTTGKGVDSIVDTIARQAANDFALYKKIPATQRALFLDTIAKEIENRQPQLVAMAKKESNLPDARLNGEVGRTTGQLRMFANYIREGSWVEAVIDTANPDRTPPKPDIRKMLVPVGPVVVFGASNFPFAFSTAGGDTASALASGSTVIIRAHFAHLQTSILVFEAIDETIKITGMPANTVQHVTEPGNGIGKALLMHPAVKGVGFTGSFKGGAALMDYAAQREVPIPVFAEMSSINPVVFYPDTLEKNGAALAATYAGSITLGVGQFCTNPGLLLGIKSDAFDKFLEALGSEMAKTQPATMLHEGICKSYAASLEQVMNKASISLVGQSGGEPANGQALPLVASVSGEAFLQDSHLAEEIFGPYSLAVGCANQAELVAVLQSLQGQLTTSVMATEKDVEEYGHIIDIQQSLAGRIMLNNVPTGVEVSNSMVHGGPFPATSDARFTSVGTSAIKRWVRPMAYQNFYDSMLPEALQNSNPSNILRLVDNEYTRQPIQN